MSTQVQLREFQSERELQFMVDLDVKDLGDRFRLESVSVGMDGTVTLTFDEDTPQNVMFECVFELGRDLEFQTS